MKPNGILFSMTATDLRLDAMFSALSDPTRRRILSRLRKGSASVGELAGPFAMTRPAVSKHLAVLERARLVRRERIGRTQLCHLRARPLLEAKDFIEQYSAFWEDTLGSLAKFVERDHA